MGWVGGEKKRGGGESRRKDKLEDGQERETRRKYGLKLSLLLKWCNIQELGARCSSVVRVFAHGVMGHRIDPSGSRPIELFLVPASAPRLV